MNESKTATPEIKRLPYSIAKDRMPKGACYCNLDPEQCYAVGHWEALPVEPEWPDNALDTF